MVGERLPLWPHEETLAPAVAYMWLPGAEWSRSRREEEEGPVEAGELSSGPGASPASPPGPQTHGDLRDSEGAILLALSPVIEDTVQSGDVVDKMQFSIHWLF